MIPHMILSRYIMILHYYDVCEDVPTVRPVQAALRPLFGRSLLTKRTTCLPATPRSKQLENNKPIAGDEA